MHQAGEKVRIIWRNAEKSRADLGYPETVRYLKIEIEGDHQPNEKKDIRQFLKYARKRQGRTLFDVLVFIMRNNKDIDLVLE